MNRTDWLREMRRAAEERYTSQWAPLYPDSYGRYSNASHLRYLQELLDLLPEHGAILDAACGAGRYFSKLLEHNLAITGLDQSQGMIERAKSLYPEVDLQKIGLQEMTFENLFDGVICIDAMENVPPEDWPVVLANFHKALKPEGCLYFTVEVADEADIEAAFQRALTAGLPVAYGEWPDADPYHYYPPPLLVKEWARQAGFELLKEGYGDEYYHVLLRKT